MEYQVNIIFILVFCFSIVESISHSDEARYGAQQGSKRPSNQNQPQQYQNYARPQSFYSPAKNTINRNVDNRSYERNYENRQGTLSNAPGEKRLFYEGPNGRTKPHHQVPLSTLTGVSNVKEKSSLEAVPQSYRPSRPYYEYDDKNNGRFSPSLERNFQHPVNRPYYNPRVPYHRSLSENIGSRFKDTPPQKPRYFDKSVSSQNISPPLDHKYPYQNRELSSIPEYLRRVPNTVHNSMPELPVTSQPRFDINEIIADPVIQNYLATNHKRYLVLHTNGTVEHVDSLESIIQNYPNFVMFKAGDIVTNPHNSTLELTPSTPEEENFHPKIPEGGQEITPEDNNIPTYGYNLRAPYVTEKAYIRQIGKPVVIPDKTHNLNNHTGPALTSTAAPIHTTTFLAETTTDHYTTPFMETITEHTLPTPLHEYDVPAARATNTEYVMPTTTAYPYYIDTTSEFATSTISANEDVSQTYTEQPIESTTEERVTDAELMTATEENLLLEPIENSTHVYNHNVTTTESSKAREQEKQFDILSKLFNYPSAFGQFILRNFEALFPANKINNETKNKIGRRIRDVTSSDPYDVTDILEAITELALTDETTTDPADILFNTDDSNIVFPFTEDVFYTTPSSIDVPSTSNDYLSYPDTSTSLSVNEEEKPKGSNPFEDISTNFIGSENIDYIYTPIASAEDNGPLNSYTTLDYSATTNPFSTFYAETTPNPFEYLSTDISLTSTELEPHSTSNPSAKYEDVRNPFIKSITQENKKMPKRHEKTKKAQHVTATNSKDDTNPFVTSTSESNTISNEETYDYTSDTRIASDSDIISRSFTATNPFVESTETSSYSDYDLNPLTENYLDFYVTTESSTVTEVDETSSTFEDEENEDVIPFDYLPTETSSYELTTTPEPYYNINTESSEFDEYVPTTFTSAEEDITVLTSTEKPAVWFKTDEDFWEKLSDGTIPYDVVYLFQVHDQPVVEKGNKTTIFPNGTVVQEFIETVWEREGDSKPVIIQSSKTVYPDEEPQ